MAEQTTLLFGRKKSTISEVSLDALIEETPVYRNEVTQYRVEEGSDISDNIRKLPDTLSIEGIITNSPLAVTFQDISEQLGGNTNDVTAKVNQRVGNPTFAEVAQNELLRLTGRTINGQESAAVVFDVTTGLRVYTNMVFEELSFPRSSGGGQELRVIGKLVEFRTVSTEFVAVPNPAPAAKDKSQSKIDKGKQTPTDANAKQEAGASKLAKFFKSLGV